MSTDMNMQQQLKEFVTFKNVYDEVQSKRIREEFTRLEGQCYLEHAGTSLYSEKQIENIHNELKSNIYGNPHSLSASSKLSEDSIDQMRYRVLNHFNADPDEYSLVFTSGTTAALKLVGEQFNYAGNLHENDDSDSGTFMYMQDNHTSVLGMREYAKNVRPLLFDEVFDAFEFDKRSDTDVGVSKTNSLFTYSAQCNFSGAKYPLAWIDKVHEGYLNSFVTSRKYPTKWYCMVDAASYMGTSHLDLSVYKPDFVAFSFYKIFGYPTGVGALLVRNDSADALKKIYFGGGTVQIALSTEQFHVLRNVIHERLEDGTISFLSVAGLQHCFDTFDRFGITKKHISEHAFQIARYVHHNLLAMHHSNGRPIARLYSDTDYEDKSIQGGVVNFNLMRSNGEFVSFTEFLHMANLYNIHIRTGCFCNPGACQRHLDLTNNDCLKHFEAGHICGDQHNIVDGIPTGSVRASFGYMSTKDDADTFLKMVQDCFLTKPVLMKFPHNLTEINKKHRLRSTKNQPEIKRIAKHDNSKNAASPTKTIECPISTDNEIACEKKPFEPVELQLLNIFIYPIKSCGSFPVKTSWELTNTGLKYDRKWMIVTHTGACLTQKHETKLCLVKPIVDLDMKFMTLTFPGMDNISIPLDALKETTRDMTICQSKVCRDRVQGIDCGDAIAHWLEDALGRQGLRLIQQCENSGRINHDKNEDSDKVELSLSNEAQILLVNESTVQWLSSKIPESDLSLSNLIARFRANFVIRGKEPFEEYMYSHMKSGDALFKCVGPCTRCQMICIDQESGEKNIEPLRTLSENCRGKLQFGLYLRLMNFSEKMRIAAGQKIKIA